MRPHAERIHWELATTGPVVAEPVRPLTSLGRPARDRCAQLIPKDGARQRKSQFWLMVGAIVLPLVAVGLGTHSLKYAIAFVLGVALVFAILARPVLGGFLLVGLVPPLSGLEPGFLTPNVRASEALIGIVGLTVLLATRRLAAPPWGLLEWLLLCYGLVWALFGLYNALALGQHLGLSAWGTVIGQLQFFLLYRAVRVTLRTSRDRRRGLALMMATTVPLVVLAVLQEVNVGGLRTTLWEITGKASPLQTRGIIRATALFGNWAALAGLLFPLLLLLVALALSGQVRRHRVAVVVLVASMAIGLLLTTELSVLILLTIGVIVLGVQYGRARKMLSWLLAVCALSIVVVGPVVVQRLDNQFGYVAGSNKTSLEPQTVAFRQAIWTHQYLPAIAERPLTGYGNQLPSTVSWPYPESQYIALLIEGGYPLMTMYLCVIAGMFIAARRAARSPDPLQVALGRTLAISTVSLLLLGITWPFFSNGGMPQVLWCLFALAVPATDRFARAPTGNTLVGSRQVL